MKPTPGGSSSSSGGGAEGSRGGLARFRSAPATWLEALLEEEEEDPLKPNQCLTQLLTGNSSSTPTIRNSFLFPNSADPPGLFEPSGFQRQNSSPADFLGNNPAAASDAYFSNFGVAANYDYLSPTMDVSPSSKRASELDTQFPPTKFHSQLVRLRDSHTNIIFQLPRLVSFSVVWILNTSVLCFCRLWIACERIDIGRRLIIFF